MESAVSHLELEKSANISTHNKTSSNIIMSDLDNNPDFSICEDLAISSSSSSFSEDETANVSGIPENTADEVKKERKSM